MAIATVVAVVVACGGVCGGGGCCGGGGGSHGGGGGGSYGGGGGGGDGGGAGAVQWWCGGGELTLHKSYSAPNANRRAELGLLPPAAVVLGVCAAQGTTSPVKPVTCLLHVGS